MEDKNNNKDQKTSKTRNLMVKNPGLGTMIFPTSVVSASVSK